MSDTLAVCMDSRDEAWVYIVAHWLITVTVVIHVSWLCTLEREKYAVSTKISADIYKITVPSCAKSLSSSGIPSQQFNLHVGWSSDQNNNSRQVNVYIYNHHFYLWRHTVNNEVTHNGSSRSFPCKIRRWPSGLKTHFHKHYFHTWFHASILLA